MNLVAYKQKQTQKPVTFLSHENFLVYRSQPVTPVKHGNLHFNTLNVASVFLVIKKNAFLQVNRGI